MTDATHIRIPYAFAQDHDERDLPRVGPVKCCKQYMWVRADDPNLPELIADAEFYADPDGPDDAPPGLANAARGLLRQIDKQLGYRPQ